MCLCFCSVSTATRRRSAPSTPWMIFQLSHSSPPTLAPDPEETHWTETGSFSRTWCLFTLPPLPTLLPLPHPCSPSPATEGQSQELQDSPPPPPPPPQHHHLHLSYRSWTSRWTMAKTTFPRCPSSANSSSSRRRRQRKRHRRSPGARPCQAWTVREDRKNYNRTKIYLLIKNLVLLSILL